VTFSFSRCPSCQRLNIHGARCVCDPLPTIACDCEGGNHEQPGPICAERRRNEWGHAMRVSHEIARKIREEQETP